MERKSQVPNKPQWSTQHTKKIRRLLEHASSKKPEKRNCKCA